MKYAIAYLDKNGQGFSDTEPFIERYLDSKDHAIVLAKLFELNGYKKATAFEIDDDAPDSITWEFVLSHIVDW